MSKTPVADAEDEQAPVVLRPLAMTDEEQARRAHEELAQDGFPFLLDDVDGEPWPAYLARVENVRRGELAILVRGSVRRLQRGAGSPTALCWGK